MRLASRERALGDGSCLTSNVTVARSRIASGGWEGEGPHEFSRQARVVEPGSPALRRGPARTEVGDPRRVPGVHWLRAEVRDPAAAPAAPTVGGGPSATGASVRTGRAGGAADCLVGRQWDLRQAPRACTQRLTRRASNSIHNLCPPGCRAARTGLQEGDQRADRSNGGGLSTQIPRSRRAFAYTP